MNREGEGTRTTLGGWWMPVKDEGGCVGRVCMAAESPVAIINQKGSQPSVSRPAGQPRPACTEFRAGGFLPTNPRVMLGLSS